MNGSASHEATFSSTPRAEALATGEFDATMLLATSDLLAHLWSRPTPDELGVWAAARDLEAAARQRFSAEGAPVPLWHPGDFEESVGLLDEHERLFVGPGQVPCPPYESFWREDVAIDLRRSLMGPCTAELRQLYSELGLEISSEAGELPDHVAVELEALAFALSLEGTDQITTQLIDHIGGWLPRFCRAVGKEAEHPFYLELANLTLGWLKALKSYFAVEETG